ARIDLVERYIKEQGLFRTDETQLPDFSELLELDLSTVEPSVAGPRRPQDRVALGDLKESFQTTLSSSRPAHETGGGGTAVAVAPARTEISLDGERTDLGDGSVVIAAITSCTNTSNPSVMLAAGLLAKKAVERGLTIKPYVKTSLAPGSRVVTDYLARAGLTPYLEALRFHVVGYGCTTCIAEGTPVLLANGTAHRIEEMPREGGATVFGPGPDGELAPAAQTEAMDQGLRECVSIVLQDGRSLTCTPDHELLCEGGRWVRADELVPGTHRVVIGLEAPLDEPGNDETGYMLQAGELTLTLETRQERLRTLAFARLLGHLLCDGSISVQGQARMNVGQAVDRRVVLDDIELLTGLRPAATRYDERKWSIVLPMRLTNAICALPGVRVGRRIEQSPSLPDFVLDECCPVAVVREFLGGLFGADGQAPILHRWGTREEQSTLEPPQFAQSAKLEHRAALKRVMERILGLLDRCGVDTDGAALYEYPTRRSASSYPAAQDGIPRVELRLVLADGLSFVERVGFRYCIDKQMRSSAAAVYWRTIKMINDQRLWMSARLEALHEAQPELSFSHARRLAATELTQRDAVIFPHYALLEGHDRFSRLPAATARAFRPLHRGSCGFPSPVEMLEQMGVREWFAPLRPQSESDQPKRYGVEKEALTVPTFSLQVADRQSAGAHHVFDLAVDGIHAFVAGTFAVHNCIGNSGPLAEPVSEAIAENDLVVTAVLSGNRNFEARIHPEVRANYLASPPLVVAYALAGTVSRDLTREPLAADPDGQPVFLWEIWPTAEEIAQTMREAVQPEFFAHQYSQVFTGDEHWSSLPVPQGGLYDWDPDSTYVRQPPFFQNLPAEPEPFRDISGARVLVKLGDSVTTDHISPAGSIPKDSPAALYLQEHHVERRDFNSYGARRGNHEVMVRGTFGNVRLRNEMTPDHEGDWTAHQPDGEIMRIFDASERYQADGIPLLVIAGKEYGSGSSRDWAAKGPLLLGVKAVIAESYERIHRSNLVAMGILPLQFKPGETRETLGLRGDETFDITGLSDGLAPGNTATVNVHRPDGSTSSFDAIVRLDSAIEVEYYRHGGVLQMVLRRLSGTGEGANA
ncbi:MAG TPA: aconitase family protein, partial [Chloroflexota bacterium]|nr:aconitase family protein [Chloroflexota bacterium]